MAILVADDDASVRRYVGRILLQLGYDCVVVAGVGDLMRECAAALPEIVISDVSMPDGDGIEACLELGRLYPGLPVVVMTGDPGQADRALNAGLRRVLLKPFEAEGFRRVLEEALRRRQ